MWEEKGKELRVDTRVSVNSTASVRSQDSGSHGRLKPRCQQATSCEGGQEARFRPWDKAKHLTAGRAHYFLKVSLCITSWSWGRFYKTVSLGEKLETRALSRKQQAWVTSSWELKPEPQCERSWDLSATPGQWPLYSTCQTRTTRSNFLISPW